MNTYAVDYDAWADIYDVWVGSTAAAEQNRRFYVEEYLSTPGVAVELGVGNGRIAIEAARQGKALVGVDSSSEMLRRCRERAAAAGVLDRLTLLQADFRSFVLPQPAELITIPLNTIGHLVSLDDKRAGLRQIFAQLAPGGRLIFDHFVFDPELAEAWDGAARLRGEFRDLQTGREGLLWITSRYDFASQTLRIIGLTEDLDEAGVVVRRQVRRLGFSWLAPEQARTLLAEAGFVIEYVYGDFDGRPLDEDAERQVWIARRP